MGEPINTRSNHNSSKIVVTKICNSFVRALTALCKMQPTYTKAYETLKARLMLLGTYGYIRYLLFHYSIGFHSACEDKPDPLIDSL